MTIFIRILFFFVFILGYGQKEILLYDSINNKEIEFARIKFVSTENGTYSDLNGRFKINYDIGEIIISNIGYETKKVNVFNDTIFLNPKPEELEEVIISNAKTKNIFKNKTKLYSNFTSKSGSLFFLKKIEVDNDLVIKNVHLDIKNGNTPKFGRLILLEDINEIDKNNTLFVSNYVEVIEPNINDLDFYVNNFKLNKGVYYFVIEISNLNELNDDENFKIGLLKNKKEVDSYIRPVFESNKDWEPIMSYDNKKSYSFNLYLTVVD